MKLFGTLFKRKDKREKPSVVIADKKEVAEVVQQVSASNDTIDETINSCESQKIMAQSQILWDLGFLS